METTLIQAVFAPWADWWLKHLNSQTFSASVLAAALLLKGWLQMLSLVFAERLTASFKTQVKYVERLRKLHKAIFGTATTITAIALFTSRSCGMPRK